MDNKDPNVRIRALQREVIRLRIQLWPKKFGSYFGIHNYEDGAGLSILGQSIPYPKTLLGLAGLIAVLLFLTIALIRISDPDVFNGIKHRLFTMVTVENNGSVVPLKGYVRIGFWTPGEQTWPEFHNQAPNATSTLPKRDQPVAKDNSDAASEDLDQMKLKTSDEVPVGSEWETKVDENRLAEFGKVLREKLHINGFRRYEVVGEGRTRVKRGWWWIVTLPESVKASEIAKVYREFFGTEKPIYLETTSEAY